MTVDRATTAMGCAKCGAAGKIGYVQRCTSGELRYTGSFRCNSCGEAIELYGGELPDNVRALFLASSGSWRVVLVDGMGKRLELMRVLVEFLSIPRLQAVRLANGTLSELAKGTRVEVECWAERISATGVKVRIEQA